MDILIRISPVRYATAAGTELLKEDEIATGVGADLFVRKKRPGPTVGVGYIIEIYENGVKVDQKEVSTKDKVKDIINEYKLKYNTHRSFQNESQIHVTYKTKEERGESFPKIPSEPKDKKEEKVIENPSKVTTEGGNTMELEKAPEPGKTLELGRTREKNMQATDQYLMKRASKIQELLNRLVNPTIPIKKWASPDPVPGGIDIVPETQIPGGSQDVSSPEEMEGTIANQMAKKLIEYISGKSGAPDDELYNGIKSWMAKVRKKIRDWERIQGQQLNRSTISKNIKDIVASGDPQKIKATTGLDVTPEVAAISQKISLMEIGTSGLDKSSLSESLGKAASAKETANDLVNKVRVAPEGEAQFEAAEAIKKLIGEENLEDIAKELPESFSGVAVEKAIKSLLSEDEDSGDIALFEIRKKEFWNHASTIHKTANLDKVFSDWVNKKGYSFEEAAPLWIGIKKDVDYFFNGREAALLDQEEIKALFFPFTEKLRGYLKESAYIGENEKELEVRELIKIFKVCLIDYWMRFGTMRAEKKVIPHSEQSDAERTLNVKTMILQQKPNILAEFRNLVSFIVAAFVDNPRAQTVIEQIMSINVSELLDNL